MAWNRNIFANFGVLSGVVLSLFFGMAFVCCAGTDSSIQTKVDENPNLFKAETPVADTLASRMPEFAHSVFKGIIDSVPGEYYYYATDGRIDSLVQKEGERYNAVASIAYDSLNGQNNYELKMSNRSYFVNDGVLKTELEFPKLVKKYWENGQLKKVLTGNLYRDDQGNIALDSGREEQYFKSGKIQWQDDRKNKQIVFSREWNENGTLVAEIDFPNYIKKYWGNGNPREISTGLFYINDQGTIRPDSGHAEFYFENGKLQELYDWKNKQPVVNKQWNADGVLIMDLDFQKTCTEYWDNGKIKQKLEGILYRKDSTCMCRVDSGRSESYFENGKVKQQNDWKNKQLVAQKEWNENGVLVKELELPKFFKEYWKNGKPKNVIAGNLYINNQGELALESGREEFYSENGTILAQSEKKDKITIARKQWNEKGMLMSELDFPKYFKEYWNNGKIKNMATGLLYRDNQGVIQVDSGHQEIYFENGKMKELNDMKGKQLVAQKKWNENGVQIVELDFPKYIKENWNSGKPKIVVAGKIYVNDQGNFALDSGHADIYFENGKLNEQNDWKNKLAVASKKWNENGALIKELNFPKYFKECWNNGKPKSVLTGILYRDNQGNFQVDSGRSQFYFENGKFKEQSDWKNKLLVVQKKWNENGALIKELEFPKYFKEYWNNGKIKATGAGLLYRDEHGDFFMDSGHSESYFEDGKIDQQNDWKNKQLVAQKKWNENGVLIKELNFPKLFKEYWNNGKPKSVSTGVHYIDNRGEIALDSGLFEVYSERGNIQNQEKWKDKQLVTMKEWNESGVLVTEIDFPKSLKKYRDNGKLKEVFTGLLYGDDRHVINKDSGRREFYSETGKIQWQEIWKNKQVVASKDWNEKGVLIRELDFPEYEKIYSDNGILVTELKGTLYYDDQKKVQVQDGFRKDYYSNRKLGAQKNYKEKRLVSKMEWFPNGNVSVSAELPDRYWEFYDNGKIKAELAGTIAEENGDFKIKDGVYNVYAPDGKVTKSATYKDFQEISEKK